MTSYYSLFIFLKNDSSCADIPIKSKNDFPKIPKTH